MRPADLSGVRSRAGVETHTAPRMPDSVVDRTAGPGWAAAGMAAEGTIAESSWPPGMTASMDIAP